MYTCAPEVTCEGQGLLNHSSVNGISFSTHELLTCVIFCPVRDIEGLYIPFIQGKIHCKNGTVTLIKT